MQKNSINQVKALLSKLVIASKKRKNIVRLNRTKQTELVLKLLQKKGFIYGY